MITVYHLEQSRSIRILWALEELGLDYDIKAFKRTPSRVAPPELKNIHPLGKAPIVKDGDNLLVESGAILEYLQTKYDSENRFKPTDEANIINYNFWMHYAEGSVMPLLVFKLVTQLAPSNSPAFLKFLVTKIMKQLGSSFIDPRLKDHVAYIEDFLTHNEYLAGNFSFADIQMQFALTNIHNRVSSALQTSAISNYLTRIESRKAYQIAVDKDKKCFG